MRISDWSSDVCSSDLAEGSDMRIANFRLSCCLLPALLLAAPAVAQTAPDTPDIPPQFVAPTGNYDYEKREVMIPMRDGVELFTVIVVPRGKSEEHTSELQSLMRISYAVFCLKKKNTK